MAAGDREGIHLVVGGFPPGRPAAHDQGYARRRLLEAAEVNDAAEVNVTVGNDFVDLERWLPNSKLLVTYVAGPFPEGDQLATLTDWLKDGGRWFALHGTSGGKAIRIDRGGRTARKMVRLAHHEVLGAFFLNHPPIRRIEVAVSAEKHPLTVGLPETFVVDDEPYLIELTDPAATTVLFTAEFPREAVNLPFGFVFDSDTALTPDGRRVIGFERRIGDGAVVYLSLGHCHSPATNSQPFVDQTVVSDGTTPPLFRGAWETSAFSTILSNAMAWGLTRHRN